MDQNQSHSIDKVQNLGNEIRKYPRQDSGQCNFSYTRPSGEMFYLDLMTFAWRRHAGAHPDGHQQGGRKLIETSVTEFCNEGVNFSLEELINVKVAKFLEISDFSLIYMTAFSAVMKI